MIPYKLTLKNFLSYREASLDFSGLHTACICGSNGSGKSSLLEAIAWAIWGNSRAATEDDIIHLGEKEVRVDFVFIGDGNLYRVIRNRRRGQSGSLEFQVATKPYNEIREGAKIEFRPISERGMRATQQKILEQIKLDYDTFINSAYLRQGRADEFMLKRPTERKEILASLLKLDEYDRLADRAKDLSRQYKGKIELLQQTLESTTQQLQQQTEITQNITQLETTLKQLQTQQTQAQEQLRQHQASQHHRQTWEKLRQGEQQQYQTLSQDYHRLQQELNSTQQQQQELEAVLKQASEIQAGSTQFQTLQATEEQLSAKFKTYQDAQQNRQKLLEQQRQIIQKLQQQIQSLNIQLEGLAQQEQEQLDVLKQRSDVEGGLIELHAARTRLSQLDELQIQVAPLLQHRQKLQTQIDRVSARQNAHLEELSASIRQLQQSLKIHPELQRSLQQINTKIKELENKENYQKRVREKGLERHNFIDKLCVKQRDYEAQLAELDQKISLFGLSSNGNQDTASMPLCPLCDRPLDEHHRNLVVGKHRSQQQEIRDKMWVVNEQLAVAEREIQGHREEYRQLERELSKYDEYREQRGQIQAKLEVIEEKQLKLRQLSLEVKEVEGSLSTGEFAAELNAELQQLDQRLQQLDYNDQNHVLARHEEKRWRWAEIKHSQLQSAETQLTKIQAQKPELEANKMALEQQLIQQQTESELQQKIVVLEQKLVEIGYNLEEHNQVRSQLRQAQHWLTRAEKLNSAQKQHPKLQQRLEQLEQLKASKLQDIQAIEGQIDLLEQKLRETPDLQEQIQQLERQIQQRRQQMDQALSQLGSLKQQQAYLESLNTQQTNQKQQLETARRQHRVYSELAQALGKNGIQALMIENVLPQLEAETNQILARLSANQLHIQFITQRAGKGSKSSKKKAVKLIDTLDILIADAQGTRPYETYSGGEAFRINFAIRLALAKLLAQRAGTALQMLIIDEGFGTQDAEGCNRLIAAINAISSDFACILTVTHMPHLKEAFQARIEVEKSTAGSQLKLLM